MLEAVAARRIVGRTSCFFKSSGPSRIHDDRPMGDTEALGRHGEIRLRHPGSADVRRNPVQQTPPPQRCESLERKCSGDFPTQTTRAGPAVRPPHRRPRFRTQLARCLPESCRTLGPPRPGSGQVRLARIRTLASVLFETRSPPTLNSMSPTLASIRPMPFYVLRLDRSWPRFGPSGSTGCFAAGLTNLVLGWGRGLARFNGLDRPTLASDRPLRALPSTDDRPLCALLSTVL